MIEDTLKIPGTSSTEIKTPVFNINIDSKNFVKLHAPDWVQVAVYNRTYGKWILSNETRYGTGLKTLEFMSGTVEEGEDPKVTALRELREEFGYDLENLVKIEKLYDVYTNPAFLDNQMHGFYIEVEGNPKEQKLDEDEDVMPKEIGCVSEGNMSNFGAFAMLTLAKLKEKELY